MFNNIHEVYTSVTDPRTQCSVESCTEHAVECVDVMQATNDRALSSCLDARQPVSKSLRLERTYAKRSCGTDDGGPLTAVLPWRAGTAS